MSAMNRPVVAAIGSAAIGCLILSVGCAPSGDAGEGGESAGSPSATAGGTLAAVDDAALVAADERSAEWITHGRTYSEQRFSPLRQITVDNVDQLGLAWSFDPETDRGLEATPLVIDGVLYTTGSWSVVFALDARTGELKWKYDPGVDKSLGRFACCDVVNRGVAIHQGRVFVGVLDGRLVALDAADGSVLWEVQTTPEGKPYTITGAPRVVKGKVLIGNGGAEYGVRGYVTAYDAETGDQAWRFYTVPGNPADGFESEAMEKAAETWTGEWWTMGGGGTVWDSMAYDPELDLLYIGVGNGSPWNRDERSPEGGDNLYLSSVVALRPDTGELAWHYQTTPGETWDYTATQHMILADLTIDGAVRKVLMQAPKNGFFYVLDRETGELISAEKYVTVTWAEEIDSETGRPVENPAARYPDGAAVVLPSPYGGHNWQPMAFSPQTGLVYIPAQEIPGAYGPVGQFTYTEGAWNTGVDFSLTPEVPAELVSGHLLAWNPVTQSEAWRVPYDLPWSGGVLATAGGLVFQGSPDGYFNAYDAATGESKWRAYTGSGVIAAPVTFELDGEQYVSVMSGWGGAFALVGGAAARSAGVDAADGRLVTFKLGASAPLPEKAPPDTPRLASIPSEATADEINQGFLLFNQHCAVCHGLGAVAGGVISDLRLSAPRVFDAWEGIVLEGDRADRGMPDLSRYLEADDLELIKAYVLDKRAAIGSAGG